MFKYRIAYFHLIILCSSLSAFAQTRATTHMMDYEGHSIYVRTYGSDQLPPLLLIHGSFGDADNWNGVVQMVSQLQSRFQIIDYNRPGYPPSQSIDQQESLAKQADVALHVLSYNRSHRPAIVIGHSHGGAIATAFAITHKLQVSKLILIAPALDPDLEQPRLQEQIGNLDAINWLLPTAWKTGIRESYALAPQLKRMRPYLGSINLTVQYLQGDEDQIVSLRTKDYVLQEMNSAHLSIEIVPGAGHSIPQERPDVVINELNRK